MRRRRSSVVAPAGDRVSRESPGTSIEDRHWTSAVVAPACLHETGGTRGGFPDRDGRGRHRQRRVRNAHRHLRDRAIGPASRRIGGYLPRRWHHAAQHHYRWQAPERTVRLLPAHGGCRRADVLRGTHPRILLPPRRPTHRRRHPHLPSHRPAATSDLQEGSA